MRACASYTEGTLLLSKDSFDLIIVSQGSRNFEGRLLVERAIEIDRNLPVVVLTECLDMGCYLEAMQLGAADYVEKPLRADELARLVDTRVRRHNQFSRAAGAAAVVLAGAWMPPDQNDINGRPLTVSAVIVWQLPKSRRSGSSSSIRPTTIARSTGRSPLPAASVLPPTGLSSSGPSGAPCSFSSEAAKPPSFK